LFISDNEHREQRDKWSTSQPSTSSMLREKGGLGESLFSSITPEPQEGGGGSKSRSAPSPRLMLPSSSPAILPDILPEKCSEEGGDSSCSGSSSRPGSRISSSSPTPAQPTSSPPGSANLPSQSLRQERPEVTTDHHGEGLHPVQGQHLSH
jgi:hypothetical protein